ncbi:MAG: PAS domain S-box protein [Bauldia sp.]|nr:PAS domain S-box protein [Bauldia sp.]
MPGAQTESSVSNALPFTQNGALLRNILENAAVPTFIGSTDGQLLYANRAFGELLGYEPQEFVGLGVKEIVHPDDAPMARAQMADLVARKIDGYRAERRYLRKNGEEIWVLTSVAPLINERTGRPQYLTVQAIDIDRQKCAEQALAASESRLNYALEAAGQGVWDHDLRTGKLCYSRMWRLMRGFRPDEEVDSAQSEWLKRVHPDDRERILSVSTKQGIGEEGYDTIEYRERHRDGHYVWILSRGKPVEWDKDGSAIRTVGTDTDITRLKNAEARLAEETELLRVTLKSIGDGVISTDAEGRVTFMNPVAEKMTGWESSEAMGQRVEDVLDIVDEATGDLAANPVAECLAREEPFRLNQDVVLVSRSGERRDVRDSAAPVRTPQGTIIGAVLVFQDVTQSRALQRQLAHSATHDSLTGLPNRAAFERALTAASGQAHRELREHALCFIDLDRFKLVNDSGGHAAGDALLKQIGNVIRQSCRAQDFSARIGGDEFALLLADCSMAGARRVARQVIDAIAAIRFATAGSVHQIGASVGITAVTHRSPDIVEVMSEADAACYAAKASGRNSVAVYDGTQVGSRRFKQIA